MDAKERIKAVRLELKLTQVEFGRRIAVAQSYLASIENGQREITPKIFKLVCSEYGVNEKWLESGEGEMFKSEGTLIELIGAKLNDLDELDRKILIEYIKLSPSQRRAIKKYITNV